MVIPSRVIIVASIVADAGINSAVRSPSPMSSCNDLAASNAHRYLFEQNDRGEKIDSRMRRLVLSAALRASVGSRARLGSNFRPLLPKYNATPVCNQELTEYHELKHSRKMFLDNVNV
jgi:hypothetical protein